MASPARATSVLAQPSIRRWVAPAIGGVAGLASGLLGVGGGFLIVPLLAVWARLDPRHASGTSLAAILPIALVGSAFYYFGRGTPQLDLRIVLLMVVGGIGGAYAGARAISLVPRRALLMTVAIILALVGVDEILTILFPAWLIARPAASAATAGGLDMALIIFSGLVIGLLSGVTGVGGGVFIVPILVLGFGLGQHVAQGTSLAAILPTAAVGAAAHFRRGHVEMPTAAWIGGVGAATALIGAGLALALPHRVLAGLFGLFLLVAATRMWSKSPGNPVAVSASAAAGRPGRHRAPPL